MLSFLFVAAVRSVV